MWAPLRLAALLPGEVLYQSTTRSPVLPADLPGYAVRRALRFPAPDEPGRGSRLHGLPDAPCADVVVVTDTTAAAALPLAEALRPWADATVQVVAAVMAPAGPGFSSYDPAECTWLLTDLSGVALEVPTEDREELIQGGRHYAEMLPVEYQPDAAYTALFDKALAGSAARLAEAVGLVGDLVLDEARARGVDPVLVSLARAGTPVGILLRRWLAQVHGVEVPHYAISIVRGRGIDEVAVRPRPGPPPGCGGPVRRRLDRQGRDRPRAGRRRRGPPRPGPAAGRAGRPRLVHRPVRHPRRLPHPVGLPQLHRLGPGVAHRAARRPDRAGDVPRRQVLRRARPGRRVRRSSSTPSATGSPTSPPASPRRAGAPGCRPGPTWDGWRAVERVAEEFGIADVNLVKPGVGETTRVLLRRVPWQVLVRPDRAADLEHVLVLAEQRGVPVVERPDLPYSCIGLIRPATPVRALVAVDLDQTVVYSRRSAGRGRAVARRGAPRRRAAVVDDGRRGARLRRARRPARRRARHHPHGRAVRADRPARARPHAVCANGGVLLRRRRPRPGVGAVGAHGVRAERAARGGAGAARRGGGAAVGPARPDGRGAVRLPRRARPRAGARALAGGADRRDLAARGWTVSVQGRKVYAVPAGLSKARGRVPAGRAARAPTCSWPPGDSLLDRPLLELAVASGGAAVRPAHGELHEQGWRGAHVTARPGPGPARSCSAGSASRPTRCAALVPQRLDPWPLRPRAPPVPRRQTAPVTVRLVPRTRSDALPLNNLQVSLLAGALLAVERPGPRPAGPAGVRAVARVHGLVRRPVPGAVGPRARRAVGRPAGPAAAGRRAARAGVAGARAPPPPPRRADPGPHCRCCTSAPASWRHPWARCCCRWPRGSAPAAAAPSTPD